VQLQAGGSSHRQWRKVSEPLQHEFDLIAPDLWGFGDTDLWPGDSGLSHDDQASLVNSVMQQCGVPPCVIVGHSYGGATAIRFALANPAAVSGLVLIEPIVMPLLRNSETQALYDEYEAMAKEFLTRAENNEHDEAWRVFLDYRNGPGTWDKLPDKARDRFRNDTQSSVEGFYSNLSNPTTVDDLGVLHVPALVLCGQSTTMPDRRVAEIVANALPNSEFKEIPDAGHMSPLSHPELVADSIQEFCRRVNTTS